MLWHSKCYNVFVGQQIKKNLTTKNHFVGLSKTGEALEVEII
jgi:hypothetical protein